MLESCYPDMDKFSEMLQDDDDCKQSKIDLKEIPIRALRVKSRTLLSKYLNAIQVIPSQSGSPRDYRGIADLFGLDNPSMSAIDRSSDPMKMIIENIEKEFKACQNGEKKHPYTVQDLVDTLETIERYDVIDDLVELFREDAHFHIEKMQKLPRKGIAHDLLTVDDSLNSHEDKHYDAYVCYADEDIDFVTFLADYLESPQIGLRLFIRDRDLLLGTMRYEAYTKLIEQRCNYVIIILTPDFVESEECKYQTLFATDLAIQDRERKLIPIILKSCNIPPFVRLMSKIDFSRRDSKWEWVWRKLIFSISSKPLVITSPPSYPRISYPAIEDHGPSANGDQQAVSSLKVNQPIISTTSTSLSIRTLDSLPPIPTAPYLNSLDTNKDYPFDSGRAESLSFESTTLNTSNNMVKTKKNWIRSIKQKLVGLGSSDSSSNGYNSLNDCDPSDLK